MFKISKLTDYGVVILHHLAQEGEKTALPSSARDLAALSGLPLPTVSKLLKLMAKHRLVTAKRGASGGYELLEHPDKISVLRLIEIFEGPPAVTACMTKATHRCQIEPACPQRNSWHLVQKRIAHVLSDVSLAELMAFNKPFSTEHFGA